MAEALSVPWHEKRKQESCNTKSDKSRERKSSCNDQLGSHSFSFPRKPNNYEEVERTVTPRELVQRTFSLVTFLLANIRVDFFSVVDVLCTRFVATCFFFAAALVLQRFVTVCCLAWQYTVEGMRQMRVLERSKPQHTAQVRINLPTEPAWQEKQPRRGQQFKVRFRHT